MSHKDLTVEQKIHIQEATNKAIKDNAKKRYPVSDKDKKDFEKESGTNSYASENKKIIKALKKD